MQAGIWNCDGQPVDPKLLDRFCQVLELQRPDSIDVVVENSLAMFYAPFHTTPESQLERQPYKSGAGNLVTWDGRLDNREDLVCASQTTVQGHPTDIELITASFEREGTDCFRCFAGDWALSVWNPRRRELILAVDRMSIRHLFYWRNERQIWWSTEIADLLQLSNASFDLDNLYVSGYLANEADSHLTPYRSIRQVPFGAFVRFTQDRVSLERYWRPGREARIQYKTDADYEHHFRYLFRQAVRRRLRSNTPILAELSGGIDSSSIVCMADDLSASGEKNVSRVDTLSLYDRTEPDGDDWIYFHKIEQLRGRHGWHLDVSVAADVRDSFRFETLRALPGYPSTGKAIANERAHILRAGGYRVILSGIGGDEFLGGIPDPSPQLGELLAQLRLISFCRGLLDWSLAKRRPAIQLLWEALLELIPPRLALLAGSRTRVEKWIKPSFARQTEMAIRQLDVGEYQMAISPVRRYLAGGHIRMANMMAKFQTSSDPPHEYRYPYLDQDLLTFIASIPQTQLLRPGQRRSLMRRALARIVPDEILSRRTKQFAARTPIAALAANWHELEEAFRTPLCSQLGYIDGKLFLEALRQLKEGRKVHLVRVLKTIALEFWLRHLVERNLLKEPVSLNAATASTALSRKTENSSSFCQVG